MSTPCVWANQCGGPWCQTCQHIDDGTDAMDLAFYIDDLNDRHAIYHQEQCEDDESV